MNMCSKCGGSRVCECDSGSGSGNGFTMWIAGANKQQQQQKEKHPKIPKRGPGVAELEKILREQETSDSPATQRGKSEGFSISLSWPSPNLSILHSQVPSFSPGIGSMYGNSINRSIGWNGGGESSERELFHMNHTTWEPKSNLNEVFGGTQSDDSLSTTMINQFHGKFNHQDEQKIAVGIKQTDTSSLDKSVIPQFNESDGVSSYNHTNECYRDANWGSTIELNNRRFNSESDGSSHANFPQFVVSEIPPPAMPSSPSVHSDGHDGKPFFNFLEVKDQEEVTTSGSSNDGIDLTLTL